MVCEMRHIVIRVASNGVAMICSTDREGIENEVLKEKPSDEMYRDYYCANCKKAFDGTEIEGWQEVRKHFGTKPTPPEPQPTKQTSWLEEAQKLPVMEINDTRIHPSFRKGLKVFADERV